MTRFELYKDNYYKELERKKSLNDALTFPIGIISGLIAWQFYFFTNFYSKDTIKIPNIYLIFFAASFLTIIISIYFLALSYFEPKFKKTKYFLTSAYDYYYIDFLNVYEAYYKETSNITDLEELLIDHYVSCADYNTALNDRKTARMLRAKIALIIGLIFNLTLMFYPLTNKKALNPDQNPQKIIIIDTVKITNMSKSLIKSGNEEKPMPKPKVVKPTIRILPEVQVPKPGKPLNS